MGYKMKRGAAPKFTELGSSPLEYEKVPTGPRDDGSGIKVKPKTNVKRDKPEIGGRNKGLVEGLIKGGGAGSKQRTKLKYGPDGTQIGPKIPKGHPVTPPTTEELKKSKGTLKGLTGFEYDFPIVSKVHKLINPVATTKRKIELVKNIGKDIVKKGKKIKKYFTQR